MDLLETQSKFYSIFEMVMRDNIKMIHGNSKWLNRLTCFYSEKTISIRIPALILQKGTKARIRKTDVNGVIDRYMGGGDYTYLDFCLKRAVENFTTDLNLKILKRTEE